MIGIAILGYGYWGPKLARNFATLPGARVVAIADPDSARRAAAALDHPAARIEANAFAAIEAPDVAAVAIAALPAQHHPLALAALDAGKHVLVEKPCGLDVRQAREIVAAAETCRQVLLVDLTFVYAPAVTALAAIVQSGELGDLVYIDSVRTNLARFDPATGVVRDLAVHDLAILDHLIGRAPQLVTAAGRRPPGEEEDFAAITLDYGGVPAHLHVDCLSPVKRRRLIIGGSRGIAIYDDMEPVEKVRLYRRDAAPEAELRTGYRSGPVTSPPIAAEEPLARLAAHFLACIETGAQPLTGGACALRVLTPVDEIMRRLHDG